MIQMFSKPAIPAAVLSLVATIGWTIQGVGLAFYFRQVRPRLTDPRLFLRTHPVSDLRTSQRGWTHY
jgi:hypothetical protein